MNSLKTAVFATALILFANGVSAQDNMGAFHSKHFLFGAPGCAPTTNDLIIRDSYALSNNRETKFADWVTYRLTPQEVSGTVGLNRT